MFTRVRVANELGAANGQGAKFATIVSTTTSFLISLFASLLALIFHDKLAMIFSSSQAVIDAVDGISILLALTILLNGIQPVLSGKFPKIQYMVAWLQDGDQFLQCVFSCYFLSEDSLNFLNVTFPGVAIGSGWQGLVAYVNIGSYYLIGVPLGVLLGWGFNYGVPVCLCRKTSLNSTVYLLFVSYAYLVLHFCREYGLE